MLEKVPCLRQPARSNRCLPIAILAVLLFYEFNTTLDEVSVWCHEDPLGCIFDDVVTELRRQEFEAEDLTGETPESIVEYLHDGHEPTPLIVTLRTTQRAVDSYGDHAVVLADVWRNTADDDRSMVRYMDPLSGQFEVADADIFWRWWNFGGCQALRLRP